MIPLLTGLALGAASAIQPVILRPEAPSPLEALAAKEVRRYVYQRTGEWLPILTLAATLPDSPAILVARQDRPLVRTLADAFGLTLDALEPEAFRLKTVERETGRLLCLLGGKGQGVLYASYQFAEHLGVRFALEGDLLPDAPAALTLPVLDERDRPLFAVRGLLPFHDFPEGPDWWNLREYRAYISQLAKLRLNFIGLHAYPDEPTVWTGDRHPISYFTTARGNWGYKPKSTADFLMGSSRLFDRDPFGSDVMEGAAPWPATPEARARVVERAATLLRGAFGHARRLGLQTAAGVEVPLREGAASFDEILRRASAAYPLDFFWLWTPEAWTWREETPDERQAVFSAFRAALDAADRVRPPFQLAVSGWVLGPQHDRALFDLTLPQQVPMASLSRLFGQAPVDAAYGRLRGRPAWALPWLEDDPNLTFPQLWVGRTRHQAFQARQLGVTGLVGLHWRTKGAGTPNVWALARSGWASHAPEAVELTLSDDLLHVRGTVLQPTVPQELPEVLLARARQQLTGYNIGVPAGQYTITLKFLQPFVPPLDGFSYKISIQGRPYRFMPETTGKGRYRRALDQRFPNIIVLNGRLDLSFDAPEEAPALTAIVVEGGRNVRREIPILLPDMPQGGTASPRFTFVPTEDLFRDWARAAFGDAVARPLAALLVTLDGRLPRPGEWVEGPGGLTPDTATWPDAAPAFAFVNALESLRADVRGPGARARYEDWLASFQFLRAAAHVRAAWGTFRREVEAYGGEAQAHAKQLMRERTLAPLHRELVRAVRAAYAYLLQTVATSGELGTLTNWETHILPRLPMEPSVQGQALPDPERLPAEYDGPPRLIIPAAESHLPEGEAFTLRALILARDAPERLILHWRPMGGGAFAERPFQHVARGVYAVTLDQAPSEDFECYVRADFSGGRMALFPPAAPLVTHTVVRLPP